MPALNGDVREHVVQEMREEIRSLATEGMSTEKIAQSLDGHRTLTNAELGLIELLTYHAVAEVNGHY
jgi:IS30 family transposase